MDSLSAVAIVVQVAETRSFTEAGRILGVSASAVGKSIARMEERLRVRLFHRSTRSVTVTAEGALFLERCRRILAEISDAEAELADASAEPRGRLRIGVPQLLGLVMPAFDGFMERYPDIALEIDLSDRMVDVIEDGFDAVIRTGEQHDSRLVSRKLGTCGHLLVGSPAYFKQRGVPIVPRDLLLHSCLQHRFPTTGKLQHWPLSWPDGQPEMPLPESMIGNTVEATAYLALRNKGIAFVPAFIVRDAVAKGELVTVLDDFHDQKVTFWLLRPYSRFVLPKVRAFTDYMSEHLVI